MQHDHHQHQVNWVCSRRRRFDGIIACSVRTIVHDGGGVTAAVNNSTAVNSEDEVKVEDDILHEHQKHRHGNREQTVRRGCDGTTASAAAVVAVRIHFFLTRTTSSRRLLVVHLQRFQELIPQFFKKKVLLQFLRLFFDLFPLRCEDSYVALDFRQHIGCTLGYHFGVVPIVHGLAGPGTDNRCSNSLYQTGGVSLGEHHASERSDVRENHRENW
mmetsp:Transcript_34066/g.73846  ORF Transcript_34066/g.73846 Transcript_34066/m.73846 type:complete len:215 (-) Transcript_34066:81-725(-)